MSHDKKDKKEQKKGVGQGVGGGPALIVLTEDQMAQVEALASVLSVEQISDYLGISKATFYLIMDRQPDVFRRYQAGKARAIASVAGGLLQKARSGDTQSAIFYLKTRARWSETTRLDHTSSDGSMGDRKLSEAVIKALESKHATDSGKDS